MLGFFLPGDSLLITAGIFAAKGDMNIVLLCVLLFFAATIGNIVGYFFGHKVGKRLLHRKDSTFFKKKYIENAQNFYKQHGGKAIIIARFMPIIRTFAPIVAGIADMEFRTFLLYSIIGSLLWAVGLCLVGYYIGSFVPDKYLHLSFIIVIFVALLPVFYHSFKSEDMRKMLKNLVKRAR